MTPYRKATPLRGTGRLGLVLLIAATLSNPANAGSLTQKGTQILARAIGFLEPPPSGTATVAIAYDASDPASKQDAETIAGYFADGLKAGAANLKPKVVEVAELARGGFIAIIAASGTKIDQVFSAAQTLHVACVTADTEAVQGGHCVMSVKSEPKIEIQINSAAAARSGVVFGSAFLLMARAY